MITQKRLQELLCYDPVSGDFIRRTSCGGSKAGAVAGSSNSYYGYIHICLDRRMYKAHRLAFLYMTGEFPAEEVDHIDGDRSNNSWHNLKSVSRSENSRNCCIRSDNSSGNPGVGFHKKRNQWRARVGSKHLGWFSTKEEAIACRQAHEKELGYSSRHGCDPSGYKNSFDKGAA